jgi:hypothetical protein
MADAAACRCRRHAASCFSRHCFSPCRYAAAHYFSTPRDYSPFYAPC